jgi:hypothetical protein
MEEGRGEEHEKKEHGPIVDCKRRIREHARTRRSEIQISEYYSGRMD